MNHELAGTEREVNFASSSAAVRQIMQNGMLFGEESAAIAPDGWSIRASREYVPVGDRLVVSWLEVRIDGDAGTPSFFGRIEVRSGVPRVVDFGFHSADGQGEVRQSDLRSSRVSALLQLPAAFSLTFTVNDDGRIGLQAGVMEGNLSPDALSNITRTRTNRKVTPEFLEEVAEVYRSNIRGAPTKAVKDRYFVSQRMASEYVRLAREKGLLPKTTKGQKKA